MNFNKKSPKIKALIFAEALLLYAFIYNPWTKFPYTFIIIIAAVMVLTYMRYRSLKNIGLKNNYTFLRVCITALLAFLILEPLMDFIIQPLVNKIFHEKPDYSGFGKITHDTGRYLKYIAFVWVSAAIGEELFFRGYLFERLGKLLPAWRSKNGLIVLITAVLFSLPHIYQGPAGWMVTLLFGLAFGFIYLKTQGNLWVNILVHGLVDTLFLTLVYTGNLAYYELVNQHILKY